MIGSFPDPYPDEVLYSVAARYHHRYQHQKTTFTTRDLFNHETYRIPVDFPTHLDVLISNLPPGHMYSADQLIDDHTLLPFFLPFMPADRIERTRASMRGFESSSAVYSLTGLLTSGVHFNNLRYCPLCAAEDQEIHGEAYWHRVHQVPAVAACAAHAVFLNEGSPRPKDIEDWNQYFGQADAFVDTTLIKPLDLADPDHQIHLHIAEEIAWMAANKLYRENSATINLRYRYVLFNKALASFAGNVSLSKIKEQFKRSYSLELRDALGCSTTKTTTWIDRLFQSPDTAQHPVRHLLFMHFIGQRLRDFVKLPKVLNPFGKPPFPCLNALAAHYKERVVTDLVVRTKQKSNTEIAGTFTCSCGFAYKRFGRDPSGKRRFEFDRVITFGDEWDSKMREMFEMQPPSLDKLALRLNLPERTVQRQLVRLGLTEKHTELMPKRLGKARYSFEKLNELRDIHRAKWLKMKAENPSLSRSSLRFIDDRIFRWLYVNDRDWLYAHSPPLMTSRKKYDLVDWNARDSECAAKIEALAAEIKALPGRPVFASKCTIQRKLKIAHYYKRADKIPLITAALAAHSETFEEYSIRRIQWGIEECLREGAAPAYDDFVKLTGITKNCQGYHPTVKERFDEALLEIVAGSRQA